MTRATLTAVIALLYCAAAATPPPVTFESPCSCRGEHAKGRLSAKNDPALPPADASAIQAVTPSDVYSWPEPSAPLTWHSERVGIENRWFALTGRVVAVQVEADGDLHIALGNATDHNRGIVVCEIPAELTWCEIRKTIFSWTRTRFTLHVRSTRELTINERPIITVVGKAFWDIGHAPEDRSNRRVRFPNYAVWEIHPVMALHVVQ